MLTTTYYVNDGARTDDVFTSEAGSSEFDGLTTATPKPSIQEVLTTYELTQGDVILVDTGQYTDASVIGSTDAGFEIRGTNAQSSKLLGHVTVTNTPGVTLRRLVLENGVTFDGATGFTLADSLVRSSSTAVLVTAAAQGEILGNDLSGGAIAADLSASLPGSIQFNRIHDSAVGIEAGDRLLIAHNVFFANTDAGIQVQGKADVRVVNNTLYATQGDNVRAIGEAREIQLLNNILWAKDGYDIYVANDSQSGFFSDYNTLHATDSGKLVWWTRDFDDILDWQADVDRFDLHSLGSTAVNPDWSEPRFVDQVAGDYHIAGLSNGLRSSSPTIDAGSPFTDQALPGNYQNLLANPGFESGLVAWNANAEGSTNDATQSAFEGQQYYSTGSTDAGYVEQTVDLLAAGYSETQLDSRDFVAVFGARVRVEETHLSDRMEVTLSFWSTENTEISSVLVPATVADDRWGLVGDRVHLPVGTRYVKYRLLFGTQDRSPKSAYFDNTQLFVVPDTMAPDQGAYGNTVEDLDLSSDAHLALRWPDLYTDWQRDRPHTVRWDSYGNTVYGHTDGYHGIGISLSTDKDFEPVAQYNVVYGNDRGMAASDAEIRHNRVFGNESVGIAVHSDAMVHGNVVYANGIGIDVAQSRADLTNNIVYANREQGVVIRSSWTVSLVSNTIYEVAGDAIHLSEYSKYYELGSVVLRNNAIQVDSGYAIVVPPQAQAHFTSDFNDLWTTGTGQVGYWQGASRPTLSAWQNATFQDRNSMTQNPQWVDPAGADGILGADATSDGRDDDFHPQSIHGSFRGGALAPVEDPVTGLPVMPAGVETIDTLQSPLIDRGSTADDYTGEPAPNGGFINLGAYGNTPQASKSPAEYVLVSRPDGGEVWPAGQAFDVRWRSHDVTGLVDITLVRPGFSQAIAIGTENDGQYNWLVPDTLEARNDYRIQVTRKKTGGESDQSNQVFTIAEPAQEYFVATTGADSNSGLSLDQPKASIRAVLEAYDMQPAAGLTPRSVIYVAPGTYDVTANIVIGAEDSGVRIAALDPEDPPLLNRGNTAAGSYVFALDGADEATLENLRVTGAEIGVSLAAGADADQFEMIGCEVSDNAYYGLDIRDSNDDASIISNTFFRTGPAQHGAIYVGGARATVANNHIFGYDTGIMAWGPGDVADQITIVGNRVHDNTRTGIDAWNKVLVDGNIVFGQSTFAGSSAGISLYGATAVGNTLYGNGRGIVAGDVRGFDLYDGVARENVLYDNQVGIAARLAAKVQGNRAYSNDVGIHIQEIGAWDNSYEFSGEVSGNLVYNNAEQGILIEHAGDGSQVSNNTVYQPQGDAIRVQEMSRDVELNNNILTVGAGYALSVSVDSSEGLASDYNIIRATGTGKFGLFVDREFEDPAQWYYETGLDQHSHLGDAQFIDPDGADGVLGFSMEPVDAPRIIDDGDTGFELTGMWDGASDAGYGGDYVQAGPGEGGTARWTFTDLVPGETYQVSVTWPSDSNLVWNATYGLYENGRQIITIGEIGQRKTPADFQDAGYWWQRLLVFHAVTDSYALELRTDEHYAVRADAAHLVRIVGDAGYDDNFHVSATSPAIDAGAPATAYLRETWPNGNRVNAGAFGNTPEAASSQNPVIHVTSPNGLEKFEIGQVVDIQWQSAGLTQDQPVALINAGGEAVDLWSANMYQSSGTTLTWQEPLLVDTSGISNPPPMEVYATSAWYASAPDDWNTYFYFDPKYRLPVPAGEYTVRLHFMEPDATDAGQRVFDILLNGETVRDDYDICDDAGGHQIATAQTFDVSISGNEGILLELIREIGAPILAAIEVSTLDPSGQAAATVDLSWHDGDSWRPIASEVPLDHYGRGAYSWIPDTVAANALVRVAAHADTAIQDTSDRTFMVTHDGSDYYVNPPSQGGDNRNSGKSPQEPMASLAALLRTYDLDAGDIAHVGSGYYPLLANLKLIRDDSGVVIQGPPENEDPAILDRRYQGPGDHDPDFWNPHDALGGYVFDIQDITDVTIDRLHVTGAFIGINISPNDQHGQVTISSSELYGNAHLGINAFGFTTFDEVLIEGNRIYDNGGAAFSDQGGGVFVFGNGTVVRGNYVYGNVHVGIGARYGAVVENNTVFDHRRRADRGILVYQSLATGNIVYRNDTGISVGEYQHPGGAAVGNTLYANEKYGLVMYSGEARENVIYSSKSGIGAAGSPTIANNLVYDTTKHAISLQGVSGRVINNTLIPTRGNAVRVEAESASVDLRNNILYAGDDGYAISAASDSQYELTSDYNLFQLPGTGKLGQWGDVVFSSLIDWQYELGLDRQSRIEDPLFIDADGADDVLGFSYDPVGAARIIDDGDPGFTATGQWTISTGEGYGEDYRTSTDDGTGAWAEWTFAGLTAGQPYQLSVTWPQVNFLPWHARYEVYDGTELLSVVRVDQSGANPDDFQDAGIDWERLGVYQSSSDVLTVVLRHDIDDSGERVLADAVHLVPVAAHHGADDDFHVRSASPAIDAGDPNSYYFREPWPNGGRANLGAYGNSLQAAESAPQIVQVVSPNGGDKLEQSAVDVQWRVAGYGTERAVALVNVGGPSIDNWLQDEFRVSDRRDSAIADPVDVSGVAHPAPLAVYQSYASVTSNFNTYTFADLSYHLPLLDGNYTVRLHFVEPIAGGGGRLFDIRLQGTTVADDFSIFAEAGTNNRAIVRSFAVDAVDGDGLLIELLGKSLVRPALSAIEIVTASPSAPDMPLVDLEFSADGGTTWELIATDQTPDRYGPESFTGTVHRRPTKGWSEHRRMKQLQRGTHRTTRSSSPTTVPVTM